MQSECEVILTLKAQNDLKSIAAYHKMRVGPVSAQKVTSKLLDKIDLLKDFPDLGAYVPSERIAKAGFRMLLAGDYLCFYTQKEGKVIVHHIVHGSTNYIKRLFPENP